MDAELYRRVAKLEKEVRILLDLNAEARDQLRPRDAMAICDDKGALGPGLIACDAHEPVMIDFHFVGDMAKTVTR